MAKRLIDAEKILKFCEDGLNNPDRSKAFGHDAIEIMAEIQYAPTVDAVEVCRCKDCRHVRGFGGVQIEPDEVGICRITEMCVCPDDFCSCGAKMDGGADNANS